MKGILCVMLSAFGFAVMNVCVRLAGDIPTMEKTMFRNLFAVVIALAVLLRKKPKMSLGKEDVAILFVRSMAGTIGVVCNFYAIDHLVVSDASMLNKLSPFFTIGFSALFLKEKVTLRQVLYVCLAFAGMLFIVKPSGSFVSERSAALIGALGGVAAGGAYTAVRGLGRRGVPGEVTVLFFSSFSLLFCLPFAIAAYKAITMSQFLILLLGSLGACMGQFGITAAYRFAPAREISIYDYSSVLFTAIFGFFLFSEIPDALSFIGYAVIFSSALMMFLHNKKSAA